MKIKKRCKMKCCLCGEEIEIKNGWDKGNNAEPCANGRCCDWCNWHYVVPTRLLMASKEGKK